MARSYYLSWDLGRARAPRNPPSPKTLRRLGAALLILLVALLLVTLVAVGHEAREREAGKAGTEPPARSPFEQAALSTQAGYAFMLPDFVPAADRPEATGTPTAERPTDLPRITRQFSSGCGAGQRMAAAVLLAVGMAAAYGLGRRSGRERRR